MQLFWFAKQFYCDCDHCMISCNATHKKKRKLQFNSCFRKVSSARGFGAFDSLGQHQLLILVRIWIPWRGSRAVSSGRKIFYLYCFLPLDQFGTSCSFPQDRNRYLFAYFIETLCLIISHLSTSLEHAMFFKEKTCIFVLLLLLNEFRASCGFPQGWFSSVTELESWSQSES